LSFSSPTGWNASLTIEQSSLPCLYTVLPNKWLVDYRGGYNIQSVSVESGCAGAATSWRSNQRARIALPPWVALHDHSGRGEYRPGQWNYVAPRCRSWLVHNC
jgi:hypothetical protein